MPGFNPFVRASKRIHPYAGHGLVAAVSLAMLWAGARLISGALRGGNVPVGLLGMVLVAHALYWLVGVTNLVYWTSRATR